MPIIGSLIDAQLVGDEGDVQVVVEVGSERGLARCRWWPDVGTLDVLSASSPTVEAFVYADHEVQDEVETLHTRYVSSHRMFFRGSWTTEIDA